MSAKENTGGDGRLEHKQEGVSESPSENKANEAQTKGEHGIEKDIHQVEAEQTEATRTTEEEAAVSVSSSAECAECARTGGAVARSASNVGWRIQTSDTEQRAT